MSDLDSTSKRRSSVQAALTFVAAPPLPDGTLDAGDRQHMAYTYSGVLAEGAVVVAPTPDPVYSGFTGMSGASLYWSSYIKNRRR